MVVDDDRVYLEMRSKPNSITASYCLGRHYVFAVRQRREVRVGVTPRYIPKHSSEVRVAGYRLTEDTRNT
jgi:hypothetical protein